MSETRNPPAGRPSAPAAGASPRRPTRRRARSSVLAQGEPLVWLTGGGLVIACLMIIGLLALVAYYGLSTFWPVPISKLITVDGRIYMGELSRTDRYRPDEFTYDDLPEDAARQAMNVVEANDGFSTRRLFRTGNFRLTQRHFHWVDDNLVAAEERPDWAVLVERLEWGRFYGFPVAFVEVDLLDEPGATGATATERAVQQARQRMEDGDQEVRLFGTVLMGGREWDRILDLDEADQAHRVRGVARYVEGAGPAWEAFGEHHRSVRALRKERRRLEKHDIGKVNHRQEQARQQLRLARLRLQEAEQTEGPESALYRRRQAEYEQEQEAFDQVSRWAEQQYADLRKQILAIDRESGRFRLLMQTSGEAHDPPLESLLRLDEIVRAYPANQLGLLDRLGVYFSRWGEFLTDEPREANSEGGVYPAIFGTVTMTFIMIIIVVPFGVLASLYLKEYAKAGPVVSAVRIAVNNLAGVPSIVFGVFGLGFFCYGVGSFIDAGAPSAWSVGFWWTVLILWGSGLVAGTLLWTTGLANIGSHAPRPLRLFKGIYITLFVGAALAVGFMLVAHTPSFEGFFQARLPNPTYGKGGLLWASLTLALLTLPVVIVATEEALAAVPNSMREGSYACGASKWQTIKRIVLPRAMPGIMTGTVLAMARGAGEVAPLMLVGAVKLAPELPLDGTFPFLHPDRSFMHLGFHIYDVGFQSQNSEAAKPMVYTTTLLLILLVVLMNLLAIYLRNRLRKRFVLQAF